MNGTARIAGFGGRIITPADGDYEAARLTSNAANDARPAMVARARDAADVAAAVRHASGSGIALAVRSGGHSIAGHSSGDGVVVLDLAALTGLKIDGDAEWAWAGPAVRAADFTAAAFLRGRATSFGDTGSVGLGGLVPGGGIGWLVRKYGLSIDSLLAAEIVTADGELVTVSADQSPDLFWALRGGGGNFGVVTRFKLALRPIGTVLQGNLLMPASRETVRAVLAYGLAAPDDLTLMPYLMAIPEMDGIAADDVGRLGLWIDTLWAGEPAEGERVLAQLRRLGEVLIDGITAKPYPDIYPPPSGGERGAWTSSSIFLDRIDDGLLRTVEDGLASSPGGTCLVIFRILGGAAARVAPDATAFAFRDRPYLAWIIADFGGAEGQGGAPFREWATGLRQALSPWGGGAFVSFMADDGQASVAAAYPPATLERLRDVKRRYDPGNVFRRNLNIAPAET